MPQSNTYQPSFLSPKVAPRQQDTMSYKFFSALEGFKNKIGIRNASDILGEEKIQKTKDNLMDIKNVVGEGVGAIGESMGNVAKAALFPQMAVDDKSLANKAMRTVTGYKDPVEVLKNRSAAVAENRELYKKEKAISPDITIDVLNKNPGKKTSQLKHEINYAIADRMLKDGIFTQRARGPAAQFTQGIAQGASFGVFDGYASEAIKLARMMKNPYSTAEVTSNVAGNLAGGLVAYGALASRVGAGLKTIPELRSFAGKHWFLFNAGLQNLGESAIDAGIRTASGQDYTPKDFMFNMAFGAAAETLFQGVRALKNVNLPPVQKQLNQEIESFYHEFDRYPDFEKELFPRIENQKMKGSNMTWGEAYRSFQGSGEQRLAYLKGIDPGTGLPREGREGMDYSSKPPDSREYTMGQDGQPREVEDTIRDAEDVFGIKRPRPSAQKILGQEPADFKRMRETTLLKYKLNAEQRAARKSFFTTKRTIKEAQEDLIDYVKLTLGPRERGKVLSTLTKTHSADSLKRSIAYVDSLVTQMNRREMISDIKSVMKPTVFDRLPVSYQRQINELVSEFSLVKPTSSSRALGEKVAEEIALGTEGFEGQLLRKAKQVAKPPIADADMDTIKGLHDMVTDLVERGKTALLLSKGEKAFDVETNVQNLDRALDWWSKHGVTKNKILKALWFADLEYTTPDRFFDMLDGFKGYKGEMTKTFKTPADITYSEYLRDFDNIVKEADDVMDPKKLSKESMERIGIYGLWKRSDDGRFIGREKLMQQGIMEPPKLTEQEEKVYEFIRRKYDDIFPRIRQTLAESENKELEANVKNYWPMITDANADKTIRDVIKDNSFMFSKNTEAGFTQRAVGGNQVVELNAAKTFKKHLEDALYFVHMQPVLDKMNAIVNYKIPAGLDNAGTSPIKEKLGAQGYEYLSRFINTLSSNGSPGATSSGWSRGLHIVKNNTSLATMGGNIAATLKQPLSLMNAAAYVGPHNLLSSMAKIGSHPFEGMNGTMRFILENSSEVRHRSAGEHALFELSRDGTWLEKVPYVGKGVEGFRKLSFYLMKKLDVLSAMSVWDSAYKQASKTMDHADAVFQADRTVRLTQSSGMAKDLPFVMQRGEVARILHQFQSFVLNDWNLIKHDIIRSGLMRGGGEKELGKAWKNRAQAVTAAMFMISAGMLEDLISAGGDWDKAKEGGLVVGNLAQKVPLLGRAISYAKYGGTTVPALDALLKGGESGIKLATEDMTDNEREKQMIQFGQSAGSIFGIPATGQFAKQARANRRTRMEAEASSGGGSRAGAYRYSP